MNSRNQSLPGNQLVARLKAIQTALQDLRTAQRVSGSSGALNYLTNTGAAAAGTWDLTETVGLSTDTSTHVVTFTITFVGDGSQKYPNQECLLDLFITTATEPNRLSPQQATVNGVIFVANPTQANNPVENYVQSSSSSYTSSTTWVWTAKITNNVAGVPFTYFLRVSSLGGSPGTISVSRTVI